MLLMFVPYSADYSVATGSANRSTEITNFVAMVENLADHPAVIGVGFGNENNYNLGTTSAEDWYTLLDAAIVAGKQINSNVFYFTANGEISDIAKYSYLTPNIDVWGINIYRNDTFGDLNIDIIAASQKPFLLTEFGIKRPDNLEASQQLQADDVLGLIQEAEQILGGWIHFKFTHTKITDTGDEFWESSAPRSQGTYGPRDKFELYQTIKDYCTTTSYGS